VRILHIAAHAGGGIGSAFSGLAGCGASQTILLLEKPEKENAIKSLTDMGFRVMVEVSRSEIIRELTNHDIVVFNWWHHPLLAGFLYNLPEVNIRAVLWVHVSGNYFPSLKTDFLMRFNYVFFATPFSQTLESVKQIGQDWIDTNSDVLFGLGDVLRYTDNLPCRHKGFNIGYIGTLSYTKIHTKFVEYCARADISDCKFVMVGDTDNKKNIIEQAKQYGIAHKFDFRGFVPDIRAVLSEIDVFGYLLNPLHYGATENALLEAMAAGIPVIVMNNGVEKSIVSDRKTGFVVNSPDEYASAVRFIYENRNEALRIAEEAKKDVSDRYKLQDNRVRFIKGCNVCMGYKKSSMSFKDVLGNTPADWFLSAVGDDINCFYENRAYDAGAIFFDDRKGSPKHFRKYYSTDTRLNEWVTQIIVNKPNK
jgi:glycosyltransferase involved in cell wall biosynthesis